MEEMIPLARRKVQIKEIYPRMFVCAFPSIELITEDANMVFDAPAQFSLGGKHDLDVAVTGGTTTVMRG